MADTRNNTTRIYFARNVRRYLGLTLYQRNLFLFVLDDLQMCIYTIHLVALHSCSSRLIFLSSLYFYNLKKNENEREENEREEIVVQ